MNYHIIKNNFKIVEHEYPDSFKLNIFYIDDYSCQVSCERSDAHSGWGMNLQIRIYDTEDTLKYEILDIGSSQYPLKIIYFKTNIYLAHDNDHIASIPKVLLPRNEYIINNRYEITKDNGSFIDIHLVVYYLEDFKMKIIIRRLDEDTGWDDNMKLILYDYHNPFTKEIITIGQSNKNYKYLFKDTKIQLYYDNDNNYYQEIPKIIFQTGFNNKFKNILHFNSIMSFIELNPEYMYVYYNDIDCRYFLKDAFGEDVNHAYDMLVPGAFKADLIRYCFLYINGGCYFDCKQILKYPIRTFLNPSKTLVLCNDVIDRALLNAVIFSSAKNTVINKAVKDCVNNILTQSGAHALDISGPVFLFKSIFKFISKDNLILQNNRPPHDFHDFTNDYINNNITLIKNKKIILNRFYKKYYDNYLDTRHYGVLFNNNEVYYKNFQKINNYRLCIYPNKFNDKFVFNIIETIESKKLIIRRTDSTDGWFFNLKVLIMNQYYDEYTIDAGISKKNTKEILLYF